MARYGNRGEGARSNNDRVDWLGGVGGTLALDVVAADHWTHQLRLMPPSPMPATPRRLNLGNGHEARKDYHGPRFWGASPLSLVFQSIREPFRPLIVEARPRTPNAALNHGKLIPV